jgi:hypothetical protein
MQKGMGAVRTEIAFSWKDYFYIIPMVFIPFVLIYFLNKKFATRKPWLDILVIVYIFGSIGERLRTKTSLCFTLDSRRITIYNSLKAFFGYFVIKCKNCNYKDYRSYSVEKISFLNEKGRSISSILSVKVAIIATCRSLAMREMIRRLA